MLFLHSLRRAFVAAVLLLSACLPAAHAVTASSAMFAPPPAGMPAPPEVAARAFILQDLASRQTLAARNPDVKVEPASLAKLMTAYLVFQAIDAGKLPLTQKLTVSERAWKTGMAAGSRSFLTAHSQVTVDDLLKGMLVQSGNDSTVVLAEGVAGSVEAFVERMNRQAQLFGLVATNFRNPEGLSA
ncbi:MAG TPA: serine hydrolase, partial [Aquabacterium sp.]|nr:serine hydrolase [Aquabacterium sp.]